MLELRSKEKKRTMLALCKITKNNKASNEILLLILVLIEVALLAIAIEVFNGGIIL